MYFIIYQLLVADKKIGSGIFINPQLDENSLFNVINKNNKLETDVPYSVLFTFINLANSENGQGVFRFIKKKKQPQFAQFSEN